MLEQTFGANVVSALGRGGEQHLWRIIELIPAYVYIRDYATRRMLFINGSAALAFGSTPKEIVSLGSDFISSLMHPDDVARSIRHEHELQSLGDGQSAEFEYRIRPCGSGSGEWIWLLSRDAVFKRDSDGNPLQIISTITETTERRRQEEEIVRAVERAEVAQEAARAHFYEFQPKTGRVIRSQIIESVLGYTFEEIEATAAGWKGLIHPDDLEAVWRQVDAALQKDAAYSLEYRVRHKNGHYIWLSDNARIVRDECGGVDRVVGLSIDITDRKQAENRMALLAEIAELTRKFEKPEELLSAVTEAVGRHFQARRCLFNEIDLENDREIVHRDYCRGVESVAGVHKISDYSPITSADMQNGKTVVNFDSRIDPRTAAYYEKIYEPNGERSYVAVPLLRDGRWVASLWVSDDVPRRWSEQEIFLLETIAERVWSFVEKLRMDADLRKSEERYRTLFGLVPVAVYTCDAEGVIHECNRQAVELWGRQPKGGDDGDRYCGSFKIFYPDGRGMPHRQCPMAKILRGETIQDNEREILIERPDGERRNVIALPQILKNRRGEVIGAINCLYDITDRKQAEEKIRESEGRLRAMFDSTTVGFATLTLDARFVEVNDAFCRIVGYPREELKGMDCASLTHPDYIEITQKKIAQLAAGEAASFVIEKRYLQKSGAEICVQNNVSLVRDASNKPSYLTAICQDITERKRAEQALREGVRQLEALYKLADQLHRTRSLDDVFDAALDAIISALQCDRGSILLYDDSGVMRFVGWRGLSDSYRRATEGHSPWQPDVKNPVPICINDVDAADLEPSLRAIVKGEGIGALGFIPLVSNGKLIGKFMTYFNEPHVFSPGEIELSLTIARQLAFGVDRVRAEEALRESERSLSTLISNLPGFAFRCLNDENWTMLFMSERVRELTGYAAAEFLSGKVNWHSLIDPEDIERVRAEAVSHIAQKTPIRIMYRIVTSDNRRRWVWDWATPVISVTGEIAFWEGFVTDITDRKQAETEREALLEREQLLRIQAEEANRLKDEFLATVSHELRTPLNAILGWSTMAQQSGYDSQTMRRAFEVIERNARNQSQIISDILDVSRIITGKLNLDMCGLELTRIIHAAIDSVRPALDAKRIELEIDLQQDAEMIFGDGDRLQQVCWNLLSNAVKFTPSGGRIKIALRYLEDFAEIGISDNGAGIEPEFLPFVFDRFRQADSKTNRRHGGLGLGLAIVRHLVEMHGGAVSVESEGAGKGSTFTIRLPLKKGSSIEKYSFDSRQTADSIDVETTSQKGTSLSRRLDGLKILVVDDERDAVELIKFILKEQGAEASTAGSVDLALQLFEKENFDLLISDIGMPEKDGYDLIREIKKRFEKQNFRIPTIALTAYAREEDQRRTTEAGYEAFLPKPVEASELIEKIIELSATARARK